MAGKQPKKPTRKPIDDRPLKVGRGARGGTAKEHRWNAAGRPSAHMQARLRKARETIERARIKLGENAERAAQRLIDAMDGLLEGSDASTQQSAADRVLKKVGIGDVSKLDVVGGPAVVVRFGDMKGHPSPAANPDGVEADGTIPGTQRDED